MDAADTVARKRTLAVQLFGAGLKLKSFFVGQVVGSFSRLRPAAEITRQIIGDCEVRLAELAALLPAGPPAAS
jgi:hypothetical protein